MQVVRDSIRARFYRKKKLVEDLWCISGDYYIEGGDVIVTALVFRNPVAYKKRKFDRVVYSLRDFPDLELSVEANDRNCYFPAKLGTTTLYGKDGYVLKLTV